MKPGEEVDLIKTVFSNVNGEKLLDVWRKIYIERSSYEPGRSVEDGIYFEGQRSMVISILQMLEIEDE